MDRAAVQRRLDDLVQRNRFTIAVVFPAVGAVLLLASAEGLVPPPLAFQPTLILFGTLVMRLPLIAGVGPVVDRRAAVAVLALTAYAYGIELVGVRTGWPYGEFEYGIDLGPMAFGEVPVGLPVFFLPLVLNSYLLVLLLLGDATRRRAVRLLATLATVLVVDLVLDPGAVALGFWSYSNGGAYYGVPLSNYAGWVLSGTVAVVCFDLAFDRAELLARLRSCEFALDDLVSFVVLWGGVNAVYGNWASVALSVCLFAGLLRTDRFDFDVWRSQGDGFPDR
ncbi:bisanhydrobacterioruberin hydratase [Halostella sp. PRR32]|uniref:bisanhydrobacterioruberin hydratase n=1 Tax=Halostella sp. PRR32 TaxID=3098147 RepID=UPI002B1D2E81|nr:bisanhydrobacterioruberin hydratase [Halostella sp. PRR32]